MINLSESGSRQLDSSRTILAENLHAVNSTSIVVHKSSSCALYAKEINYQK